MMPQLLLRNWTNFSSGLGLPNSSLVTAPASIDRKAGRLGYLHARPLAKFLEDDHLDDAEALTENRDELRLDSVFLA